MALIVGLVVAVVGPPVFALAIDDKVPVWAVVLALGAGFVLGVIIGAREEGVSTLSTTYALHVREALGDLRKVLSGELPAFSLRDFIETGIFEPAHVLLQQDREGDPRGDVRFSILHRDGDDFVMADEDGLFPAHGHRPESRERFRLPIQGSFAGVALHTGKVQASNHLSADDRYTRHPRADSGREYESMVSVPLWEAGAIDGVLNVIATRKDAFTAEDRTYITLLAGVIDVARTVARLHPPDAPESDTATMQERGDDDAHKR